ncbi:MAG: AAA family ATPase [Clostridia bacterium]|nr:AAA family ATPase [Clostridia bacterium]
MRIDKIEIDGFGKLNQVSFAFSDGFNLIVGDNESGKSTLCEFLLAMFYELPNSLKKTTKYDEARKMYRPWNGSAFGGRVYFTDNSGTQYVLEKSFGKTKTSDRGKLLYADTWESAGDAEGVGERFFGLGREGFLKTLYVKNLDANGTVGGEEIMAKLSNMETGADEDVSYEKIKAAIEKAHAQIVTKTGRGGKRPALEEEKRNLETEKAVLLQKKEMLKTTENEISALALQEAELQAERKRLEEILSLAQEHEAYEAEKQATETRNIMSARYKSECGRLAEMKAEYASLEKQTENRVPEQVLVQAKELEKQCIIAESKVEEWNRAQQEKAEREKKLAKKGKQLMFAGVAVLILGVVLGIAGIFIHPAIGIGAIVIGVLMFAVLAVSARNKPESTEFADAVSPQENAKSIRKELEALCKMHRAISLEELENMARSFAEKEEKLPELAEKIKQLETETEQILAGISKIRLPEPRDYSEEAKLYSGAATEEVAEAVRSVALKIETNKERMHSAKLKLTQETAGEKTVAEVDTAIFALENEIAQLKKQEAAYELAEGWLEKAHREIKENFAPRLNKKTGEIFSELTEEKYGDVRVGEGFCLHYKNETGEITDSGSLSRGTYDLLYISLRLATLAVLFEEKVPTMVLDDAFSQMDDERLQKIVSYIKKAPFFGQVLNFTCHRESAEMLDKEKINLIDLNKEGV